MFDAAKSGRFDELKAMKACASEYSKYVESQIAKSSMRAVSDGVGQQKNQIDPGATSANVNGHCLHAGSGLVDEIGVKMLINGIANSAIVNTNGVGGVAGKEQSKVSPEIATNASANVNDTQQQTDTPQNTNGSESEPQRGGISINGRCYLLCNTIGKGGSAEVFRVQAMPTEAEERERLNGTVSDVGATASKFKTNSDDAPGDSAAADAPNESQSGDVRATDEGNEHDHDSSDSLQCIHNKQHGPVLGEMYALKIVFARSQEEFDQFFNEVELLQRCRNQDNVIQILDFETNPSCFGIFMVMELASHGDLFQYLRSHAEELRLCGDPYILVEETNASGESVGELAEGNEHKSETQSKEKEKTEVDPVANTSPAKISNSEARSPSKLTGLSRTSVTAQFRPGSQMKASPNDITDQTSIAAPKKRSLSSSNCSDAKAHRSHTQSTKTPDLSGSYLRKEKISLEEFDKRCRNVLSLFTQSLTGVRSLHGKKIIHSDLKPANFLVCEQAFDIHAANVEGRSLAAIFGLPHDASVVMLSVVKVADLGLAAVVREGDSHVTRGNLIGTQQFMAPEAIFRMNEGSGVCIMEGVGSDGQDVAGIVGQLMRKTELTKAEEEPRFDKTKIRYASDVWSMGVILFLMMYQRTPYAHLRPLGQCLWMVMLDESVAIQFQPCMLGNVSQEFERLVQICQGCLQHKPSDRWNLDRIFEEIHRDLGKAPYELKLSPTLQVRGTGTLVEIKTLGKLNAVSAGALAAQSSTSVTKKNGLDSASGSKSPNTLTPSPSSPINAAISPVGPASLTRGSGRAEASETASLGQVSSANQRSTKRCNCRCVTVSIAVASTGIIGLIFGTIYGIAPSVRGGARERPGSLWGNNGTKDKSNKATEDNKSHENITAERNTPGKAIQETHEKQQPHVNFKSKPNDSNDQKTSPSIDPTTSEENLETDATASKSPASNFLKPVDNGRKKAKMLAGAAMLGAGAMTLGLWGVIKHKKNTFQIADGHPGSPPTPSEFQAVLPQASNSSAHSNDHNPISVTTSPKTLGGLTGQPDTDSNSNTTPDVPTNDNLDVGTEKLPEPPLFTDRYRLQWCSDSDDRLGIDLKNLLKFLRDSGNKTELALVNATECLLFDEDRDRFLDAKENVNDVILKLLNQRASLFQCLHGPRTREKANVSHSDDQAQFFNGEIQSGQLSLLLGSRSRKRFVATGHMSALVARGVLWSEDFRLLIHENAFRFYERADFPPDPFSSDSHLRTQDGFFKALADSDIQTMLDRVSEGAVPWGGTVLPAQANAMHARPQTQSIELLSYLYHDLSSDWFSWCLTEVTRSVAEDTHWNADYLKGLPMYVLAAREQLMRGGSFDTTSESLEYRKKAVSQNFRGKYMAEAISSLREELIRIDNELRGDYNSGLDHAEPSRSPWVTEMLTVLGFLEEDAKKESDTTYTHIRERLLPILQTLLSMASSGVKEYGSAKLREILQTLMKHLNLLEIETKSLKQYNRTRLEQGHILAAKYDIKEFALMFLHGGATVSKSGGYSPWHEKAKPVVRTILDATRTLLSSVDDASVEGVISALGSGGSICARDEDGHTAFQRAREEHLLSESREEHLLSGSYSKRQKEHKRKIGHTLYTEAIIDLLKKEAAKKLKEGIEKSDPLLVRCALAQGAAEINFEDTQPLINAIQQGHEDIVSMLLDAGARIVPESEVPGFDLVPDSVKAIINDTANMFEIARGAVNKGLNREILANAFTKKAKIGARNEAGLDVFQIVAEAEEKYGTMPQRHVPPGNPRVAAYCHYFLRMSGLMDKFSMHTKSHEKSEKKSMDQIWINVLIKAASDPLGVPVAKHCNETLELHRLPKEWNSSTVPNSGEEHDSRRDWEPTDVEPTDVVSDIVLNMVRMGIQDLESESFEYIYNTIDNDNYWNIPLDLRYGQSTSESAADRNSVSNMVKNLLALQRPGFKLSATKIVQMFAGGALLDAVKAGDLFVAQRLINLGADCWIQDVNGDSPLTIAVLKDYQDFLRPNMRSFLLPRGIFVDGMLARILELRAFLSKDSNVEVKLLRLLDKPEKDKDDVHAGRLVLDLVVRAFFRDRSRNTKKVGRIDTANSENFSQWQVGDLVSDFGASESLLEDSLFVWPGDHHDLALLLNLKTMASSLEETFFERRDWNGLRQKLLMEWLQSPSIGPGFGGRRGGRVVDNLKKVAEKFGDKKLRELVKKLLPILSGSV